MNDSYLITIERDVDKVIMEIARLEALERVVHNAWKLHRQKSRRSSGYQNEHKTLSYLRRELSNQIDAYMLVANMLQPGSFPVGLGVMHDLEEDNE